MTDVIPPLRVSGFPRDGGCIARLLGEFPLRRRGGQGRRAEASEHLISLCGLGNVKEAELRILLRLLSPFEADGAHDGFDPLGPLGKARYEISQGNWEAALSELVAEEPDDAIAA